MRPRPAAATWGAVLPGAGRGGVSKEALPSRVWLFCMGGETGRSGTFRARLGTRRERPLCLWSHSQFPSRLPSTFLVCPLCWPHGQVSHPLWSHSASSMGALL